jgi:hypothetical protein
MIDGESYAPNVARGIVSMRCQFITSLRDIVQPYNATNSYPGINGLMWRLGNISNSLTDFTIQVDQTFATNRSQIMSDKQTSTLGIIASKSSVGFGNYPTRPTGSGANIPSYFGTTESLFTFMVSKDS